ncbi:MAG: MFS transporter [Phycisphaerales bacterium]
MPRLARRNYRRELVAVSLFPIGLAVVEGAVVSVMVRKGFADALSAQVVLLNFVVGLLASAPEWANLTSFFWSAVAHGRDKVKVIARLQAGVLLCVAVFAVAPRTAAGIWVVVAAVFAARVLMAGVVTLRASVWKANYPRTHRAQITGKLMTIQVCVLSGVALLLGAGKDWSEAVFSGVILGAAAVSAFGVLAYGRIRVRGRRTLARSERRAKEHERPTLNPWSGFRVLAQDRDYRRFQVWMTVVGTGNLMLIAPLAIMLRERFEMGAMDSVVITYVLPMLVIPLAIPYWSHRLSRKHVVRFRARHSWVFVAGQGVILLGAVLKQPALLYVGSVIQGIGYAGGSLAWNLGHLDFAPAHRASEYMSAHVMLNGIRGLVAPVLAVSLYESLKGVHAGAESWVFAFSVVVCAAGALGFMSLERQMGERARGAPRE